MSIGLYQTVTETDFVDAFNTEERKEQFTHEARRALFTYYDQLADDCDIPMQFDMIGVCCDWSEYDSAEEAAAECITDWQDDTDDALSALEYETTVIEVSGKTWRDGEYVEFTSVLVQSF